MEGVPENRKLFQKADDGNLIEAHAIGIEVLCVCETGEKTLRKQYKAEEELEVRRTKTVATA